MIVRRIPWWLGGILMALLLLFSISVMGADRPIGASTYVPYFAGIVFGLDSKDYTYLQEINASGAWEGILLLGALTGGFISSKFITKNFGFKVMPTGWKRYKNGSVKSRLIWSFTSGFFMILGARLAGGCTSGLFLSGMSQTAISAMIFGGIVMASLVITGHLFYNKKGIK